MTRVFKFRGTFLAAWQIAARLGNTVGGLEPELREDVWYDFDKRLVTFDAEPRNPLFLGSLSEFSGFKDVHEIEEVINQRLFSAFDNIQTSSLTKEQVPVYWNYVEKIVQALIIPDNEKKDYLITATEDYDNIQIATWVTDKFPVLIDTLERLLYNYKRANELDPDYPEDYKRLYVWVGFVESWDKSMAINKIANDIASIVQKEPDDVLTASKCVVLNTGLTQYNLFDRQPVKGFPINIGSIASLLCYAGKWGVKADSLASVLTNEILYRVRRYKSETALKSAPVKF